MKDDSQTVKHEEQTVEIPKDEKTVEDAGRTAEGEDNNIKSEKKDNPFASKAIDEEKLLAEEKLLDEKENKAKAKSKNTKYPLKKIFIIFLILLGVGGGIFSVVYTKNGDVSFKDIVNMKKSSPRETSEVGSPHYKKQEEALSEDLVDTLDTTISPQEGTNLSHQFTMEKPQIDDAVKSAVSDEDENLNEHSALTKDEYLAYREAVTTLSDRVRNGQAYLDDLVAVRTLFPEAQLPMITKYAILGVISDPALTKIGKDAVAEAATLPSPYEKGQEDFAYYLDRLLRKLVIVIPKELDATKLDGKIGLILRALEAGQFTMAQDIIQKLPPSHSILFDEFIEKSYEKNEIEKEINLLNLSLDKKLFP